MTILNGYWNKWLNKRIPAAAQHQLNHKNIFIFPAKFGLLYLSLCVLLFLLGTNYQNNLMLLLCYFLCAIFLVNLLASYINFARIDLQIGKCPEVFVDDNLPIPLWLNANTNGGFTAHGVLHFKFQATKQNPTNGTKTRHSHTNTQIDADAFSNPINLSQKCLQRGKLTLPRVTVASFYPLGLYRCWTHLAFSHQITVFPKPLPCEIQLHMSEQNSAKKSAEIANEQSGHDDFSHLKTYQVGEPLNHVAWKQLAKGRGMVSKQFSAVGNHIGWLKLSTDYTLHNLSHPNHESATALETDLSKLCYQVIELSRKQQTFGLDLGSQCIAPNSGNGHRRACLEALANFPNGYN
ncbi:DUF58 domain-containing protein [uncultured Paraglaciecola sp.]|uniref:DUF58 domain-containing protein n=1 Tax=uncultured Paraglaciecola sp. TaxID=1765024 RepID=UPI0030D72029|tara:strand:+ start:111712 stop:112761 length:1050 start_codon:yes stop_codon:yes gene_type:complete